MGDLNESPVPWPGTRAMLRKAEILEAYKRLQTAKVETTGLKGETPELRVANTQRAIGVFDVEVRSGPTANQLEVTQAHVPTTPCPEPTRRRDVRIKRPPGHLLLAAAEFVFPRRTYEEIFLTAINDMRFEHAEALAAGRPRKARWIHIRGVAGVLLAAAGVTVGDLVRRVLSVCRSVVGMSG